MLCIFFDVLSSFFVGQNVVSVVCVVLIMVVNDNFCVYVVLIEGRFEVIFYNVFFGFLVEFYCWVRII